MELKRKFTRIASLALAIAGLATPSIGFAQSEVDSSIIETYYRIERLTRNNELDTAQKYWDSVSLESEVHFVDLLESGSIFVLGTKTSEIEGKQILNITGVEHSFSQIEYNNGLNLESTNSAQVKIVYGKKSSFENANIQLPAGYKKCINLDYVQDLDENSVGDYDYVHISPRYNPNSLETKEFYTKEDYLKIFEVIKELTKNVKENDNDFVKMAKIYLAVIDYMTYDYDEFSKGYDRDSSAGNLMSLLSGTGVCTAYGDIIYNAGMYKGVECEAAIGQTDSSGHAWNVFYYTDKYGKKSCFGVDATYGDGDVKKVRQNFATNTFETNHSNYFNAGIPIAYSDKAQKSNFGYGNLFIEEFLELVKNDINIRPETYSEMKNKRYNF